MSRDRGLNILGELIAGDSGCSARARKRRWWHRNRDRENGKRRAARRSVIGVADTYNDLRDLLAQARAEAGLSQHDLDARSGLPDGYTAKLEIGKCGGAVGKNGRRAGRDMGRISTALWLQSLGLELVVRKKT